MQSRRQLTVPFIFVGTLFLLILVFTQIMAAVQTMTETPLNEAGQVHEMFRAENGELWISDFLVDEIWQVDPSSGAYTVYENLAEAVDPIRSVRQWHQCIELQQNPRYCNE